MAVVVTAQNTTRDDPEYARVILNKRGDGSSRQTVFWRKGLELPVEVAGKSTGRADP